MTGRKDERQLISGFMCVAFLLGCNVTQFKGGSKDSKQSTPSTSALVETGAQVETGDAPPPLWTTATLTAKDCWVAVSAWDLTALAPSIDATEVNLSTFPATLDGSAITAGASFFTSHASHEVGVFLTPRATKYTYQSDPYLRFTIDGSLDSLFISPNIVVSIFDGTKKVYEKPAAPGTEFA